MNDSYFDREQTQIKHFALRSYLEVATRIIGRWKDFSFVDCCAGPWESRSTDYSDTSFGIAVKVLQESRNWLRGQGKDSQMRALLIEERTKPFKELSSFAEQATGNLVEIEARNWNFRKHVQGITQFVSNPPSFAFFFIDPTGWKPAKITGLTPLLAVRPSEVLVNLMSSFIVRFLNDDRTNLEEILGSDYRMMRKLPFEEQEDEAVRRYCNLLRSRGGFKYVCALPVMKPDQDAIHFYLIYGTRNAKGVEVFKQVEKKTEEQTHLVRALRQQKSRTTLDLFSADVLYNREERYRRLAEKQHKVSLEAVNCLLSSQRKVLYDDCWAEALQFPTVYEADLREWLGRWEQSGAIQIDGRSKPNEVLKREHGHLITKK